MECVVCACRASKGSQVQFFKDFDILEVLPDHVMSSLA